MGVRWLPPIALLEQLTAAASLTDEHALIRDWLARHVHDYELVAIEVRVGDGQVDDGDTPPAIRSMWTTITRPRADLVARRGADVEIIEAKVHARVNACGQLRKYLGAWRRDFSDVGLVSLRVICRTAEIAVDAALHVAGGVVERVPAP